MMWQCQVFRQVAFSSGAASLLSAPPPYYLPSPSLPSSFLALFSLYFCPLSLPNHGQPKSWGLPWFHIPHLLTCSQSAHGLPAHQSHTGHTTPGDSLRQGPPPLHWQMECIMWSRGMERCPHPVGSCYIMEDLLYFLSSFSFDDFITYAFPDIPMDLDLSIWSYPAFPFSNMPYFPF